ncbi:hypothetical protein ZWY2020_037057 [Hordeum vulgare]|nr:hypothetical protein ZWY2020_037057 [Hordeum vulgare]
MGCAPSSCSIPPGSSEAVQSAALCIGRRSFWARGRRIQRNDLDLAEIGLAISRQGASAGGGALVGLHRQRRRAPGEVFRFPLPLPQRVIHGHGFPPPASPLLARRPYHRRPRYHLEESDRIVHHRVAAQPDDTTATTSTSTTPAPPTGFTPPVPKRFEVKPGQSNNIAGAALALPFRLGTGVFVLGYGVTLLDANEISPDQYALDFQGRKVKETSKVGQCPRPAKPIEIYEFEGCPFCRKVREMVSALDLDVLYYPCPKGGPTFRQRF